MKIQSIYLKNFRNYSNASALFTKRLSFITGNNASGKTNLLEAISLLSHGKSFRGATDENMIEEGQSDYFIRGIFDKSGKKHEIEMGCDYSSGKLRRKIKLDSKVIPGRTALVGNLISVVFSPSDIMIVEGGSSPRRRFLDLVISNQNQDYLKNLILYNRSLRQRNALLKKIKENKAHLKDLAAWDLGLSAYAEKITSSRNEFIETFHSIFQDSLRKISTSKDSITMKLKTAEGETDNNFLESLKKNSMRDVRAGFTTIGPHRHSLNFTKNQRDITEFGSQGQKRSLVLALRIAQFYYLKKNLNLSPVLLIDDVIRELDAGRRSAFAGLLHECGQAIFTTPDLDGMETFLKDMSESIEVFHIAEPGVIDRLETSAENR